MVNNQKGYSDLLTVIIVTILFFSLFRGVLVDPSVAHRALEKQGYSDIHILEKDWFFVGFRGCDSRDAAKFVVKATNSAKKSVEVNVCVGWPFKGATVRTD